MRLRSLTALSILLITPACADDGAQDSPTTGTSATTNSTTSATATDGGGTTTTTTDPSASTSNSGGTSSGGGSSGGAFIDQPDIPGAEMCDVFAQDCPDGEKCTFYTDAAYPSGANKCVPVMGDGQEGDPCMALGEAGTDNCALGHLCWGITQDTMMGTCIALCGEGNTCPNDAPCTVTNDGTLPLCLPTCDPLAPECPDAWACYDDPSGGWFCDLDVSGDNGAHGDPCEYINSCDSGLICVAATAVDSQTCSGAGSSGCCAIVCDISDPISCPGASEQCISYYGMDPAPPQFMNVGVCVIPE